MRHAGLSILQHMEYTYAIHNYYQGRRVKILNAFTTITLKGIQSPSSGTTSFHIGNEHAFPPAKAAFHTVQPLTHCVQFLVIRVCRLSFEGPNR
jgi:hypothetical protein